MSGVKRRPSDSVSAGQSLNSKVNHRLPHNRLLRILPPKKRIQITFSPEVPVQSSKRSEEALRRGQ